MHTLTKRLIAQILLFSGLLQSCHSPETGVVQEEAAAPIENWDTATETRKRKISSTTPTRGTDDIAEQAPIIFPKSSKLIAAVQEPRETPGYISLDEQGRQSRRKAPTVQPKIYTGTNSFAELLMKSDVFVDKSLFIKEFLGGIEGGSSKVVLITRPRRWGKSLNMDMLRCFLAPEVDDEGTPLPKEHSAQSLNHKLFAGGEIELEFGKTKVLKRLSISDYPALMKHQGQHPVISLGFKDIEGRSYREIENKTKNQILRLYRSHRYLKRYMEDEKTLLDHTQKQQLDRYLKGNISTEDLEDSLYFLSELLYKHFGKPVYILIDEYDMPIHSAYVECPGEFESVLKLFRCLLRAALKDNPCLAQSLVTGILRIAKGNLFSGLNNLRDYTVLDEKFTTSYGFTQQEVDELLERVPTTTPPAKIRQWYNGYNFGGHVLYNPWSIMCCLSEKGKLGYYWLDSGGGVKLIDSILLSDKIQEDLQVLVSGNRIESPILREMSFGDIKKSEGICSLLLFGGYLNPDTIIEDTDVYQLLIPNHEVEYIYKQRLLGWISEKLQIDLRGYRSLVSLLASGQVGDFTKRLQDLLDQSVSFYQTGPNRAEVFYSGFMLGLLHNLSERYILESERESGLGRPDAVLIPKAKYGDQALIIEYKVGKQVEQLATLAAKGLAQIVDKAYSTQLKSHSHVKKVLQVGLAFCGKKVAVRYEQVDL